MENSKFSAVEALDQLTAEVSDNLGVSKQRVTQLFNSRSLDFFHSLSHLSSHYRDWRIVTDALNKARAHRRAADTSDNLNNDQWRQEDCETALRDLSVTYSRLGHSATTNTQRHPPTSTTELVPANNHATRRVHVIACCMPYGTDLGRSGEYVRIPITFSDGSDGPTTIVSPEDLAQLESLMPKGLVSTIRERGCRENGKPVVHQNIVTALAARNTGLVSVEMRAWDWVKHQMEDDSFVNHVKALKVSEVIVLLPVPPEDLLVKTELELFYKHLKMAAAFIGGGNSLRAYPSWDELYWEGLKINDIAALDRIAKASPYLFSYRPKTCFGRGVCQMPEWRHLVTKMVTKRTFSYGGSHVKVGAAYDPGLWEQLRCTRPGQESCSPPKDGFDEGFWFHQEHVPSLESWGEMRVIMAGDSIVKVVLTTWVTRAGQRREELSVRELDPQGDFAWVSTFPERRDQKFQELLVFCRHVRSALLQMGNGQFETLHTAVRLDVGISELNQRGRFFVNEITRWVCADFFSRLVTSAPYNSICRAVGEKFAQEYGVKPVQVSSDEESEEEIKECIVVGGG